MGQIDAIMSFVEKGWRPYTGSVAAEVYKGLGCPAPVFGKWLYEGQKAREAVCVGCDRQCRTQCDSGFTPLPADMRSIQQGYYFSLSPSEMVRRFPLLRVKQAAYCLNVRPDSGRETITDKEQSVPCEFCRRGGTDGGI